MFVDAPEAKPDILVRGEDVLSDPVERPPSDDGSAWWWSEFCMEDVLAVNPDCNLTLSRAVKQSSGVKRALVSVCKAPVAVICAVLYPIFWVLKGVLAPVVWALKCAVKAVTGLVRAVAWAVSSVVKLAEGLICGVFRAAGALLNGVGCALVGAVKLAAFLVRSIFRALVWTVCVILKAPLCLVLAVYYAVACVFKVLLWGPVALKHAVFGPRRCGSCCAAAVVEFDPCLSELSASEICALINPHGRPNENAW